MADDAGGTVWTPQPNDLVGGYIVTNYPHPYSQHDTRLSGDLTKYGYVIAECMTRFDAELIANLLNREHVERPAQSGRDVP